ncbi:MAG: radical SAM protein [Desulfuromonadaceae bacterium]|nr:radical SAM protein [Desulfuromonadaceae bacterium]
MLRKVYLSLAAKVVKQKKLSTLARISSQFILLHASRFIGKPLCGPLFGILIVTYRCNHKCIYCDMPDVARSCAEQSRPEFDTAAFCSVIDEMAQLGVKAIALTGGEPLLRTDILELISHARRKGIMTHLSTNGALIGELEAKGLIEAGLDSISVSIDGTTAEIHGRSRKSQGALERAQAAIRMLVEERNKQGSPVRIKILTVLSKNNIDDIVNILYFAKSVGVDGVELMPYQPMQAGHPGDDFIFDAEFVGRVDKLVEKITCDQELRSIVDNSTTHLRLFKSSFSGEPFPFACHAGNASIVIDCYGDISPCHPWANWRHLPMNLAGRQLAEIWKSTEYNKRRAMTKECRRCYLNCQAELSIMLEMIKGGCMGVRN